MQNFVATVDTNLNHVFIQFWNNTTAGSSIIYTNKAAAAFTYGGSTWFLGSSNAGSATFVNEGGAMPADFIVGGVLAFEDNSSAADAIVMNYGGTTERANGGEVDFGAVSFQSTATAGNALIINYPATAPAAQGGFVAIYQGTTGGDATFINMAPAFPVRAAVSRHSPAVPPAIAHSLPTLVVTEDEVARFGFTPIRSEARRAFRFSVTVFSIPVIAMSSLDRSKEMAMSLCDDFFPSL